MQISIKNMVFHVNEELSLKIDSWELPRGRSALVCGPNDSGKSAFLNALASRDHPAAGCVAFSRPGRHAHVSFDLEAEILAEDRYNSDGDYAEGGVDHGRTTGEIIGEGDRLASVAALLGIEEILYRPFKAVSTGEARKTLIARALLRAPELLILETPCLGLDNNARAQIMALVDYIAANSRTHILFVAHDDTDELACLNRSLEFKKDGDGYRGTVSTILSS